MAAVIDSLAQGPQEQQVPLVTVILPTHNRAGMVARAIHSVLGQTMPDLEVLVVDDASTDNTTAVVRAIRDRRLRYIRLEQNGGPARARNAALRESRGDWVAFLDDDDEWVPTRLELQTGEMRRRDLEVGVLHCPGQGADGTRLRSGWPGGGQDGLLTGTDAFRRLAADWTPGPSRVIVRRSALDSLGGFDETLVAYEDVDLWLRLALAGHTFAGIHAVGVLMHRHGQARVTTDASRRRHGAERLVGRWGPIFAQRLGPRADRRWRARVWSGVAIVELNEAIIRGDRIQAWRHLAGRVQDLPWSWPWLLRGLVQVLGGPTLYRRLSRLRSWGGRSDRVSRSGLGKRA